MKTAQIGASTALAAFGALHNSGTLVYLSGTQPANPDTALSGNTALCTATFATTAFGTPSYSSPNEQAVASFTAANYAPAATGVCTFARAYKSDGTTVLGDYTVGTSGTDIIIGNTTIQTGVNVAPSLTIKLAAD